MNWAISKRYYTRIDNLVTTNKLQILILECIVCILGPYEFFKGIKVD